MMIQSSDVMPRNEWKGTIFYIGIMFQFSASKDFRNTSTWHYLIVFYVVHSLCCMCHLEMSTEEFPHSQKMSIALNFVLYYIASTFRNQILFHYKIFPSESDTSCFFPSMSHRRESTMWNCHPVIRECLQKT